MAGFRDLAARLAELAKVPSRVASRVAADLTAQLRSQFDHGVNAYGNAWAPLLPSTIRRKRGDARILRRTDALSSEIAAKPSSGAGVDVVWLPYAEIHQAGDPPRMVARKILPDGSALPKQWAASIQESLDDEFGKAIE